MKHKISPSTIARTAALALALTNQILSATGHAVLPIESAQLEQLVSTGLTVAAMQPRTPVQRKNSYNKNNPAEAGLQKYILRVNQRLLN